MKSLFLFILLCITSMRVTFAATNITPALTNTSKSNSALMGKILTMDVGVGFPNLISVEAALHIMPRLHAGVSYGMYPSSFTFHPVLNAPEQAAKFADGKSYNLTPVITSKLDAVCPFVRYFPSQDSFYFQLTYAILRVQSEITSGLQDIRGVPVSGAVIKGKVDFMQYMPTLSIGALFNSNIFFFNTSLGASVIQSLSAKVSLVGDLPDRMGGSSGDNAAALAKLESELAKNSETAAAALRKEATFIPSVYFSFGFLF